MKKVLIMLFLTLTIISCSESKSDGDGSQVDQCWKEFSYVNQIINKCKETSDIEYLGDFTEICPTFNSSVSETYRICMDNLNILDETCEGINEIETLDDFKTIEGCLNFPLKTKKDVCVENQRTYCEKVYFQCGKDKLPAVCSDYTIKESSDHSDVLFNDSDLTEYCATTENGTQEITGIENIYSTACGNVQYDCANLTDLNFKNDSWKTSCIE